MIADVPIDPAAGDRGLPALSHEAPIGPRIGPFVTVTLTGEDCD